MDKYIRMEYLVLIGWRGTMEDQEHIRLFKGAQGAAGIPRGFTLGRRDVFKDTFLMSTTTTTTTVTPGCNSRVVKSFEQIFAKFRQNIHKSIWTLPECLSYVKWNW
jgi:hypothetical protein